MCCWRPAPPKALKHHSCTLYSAPQRSLSIRWWHGTGIQDQKRLHWECGCDEVLDIRSFFLRTHYPCGSRLGSFHRQQQGHGGLQRLKSWLRLPETLESLEISAESSFSHGESCDLMTCTVWGLVASYVSTFTFFFLLISSQIKQCKWKEQWRRWSKWFFFLIMMWAKLHTSL